MAHLKTCTSLEENYFDNKSTLKTERICTSNFAIYQVLLLFVMQMQTTMNVDDIGFQAQHVIHVTSLGNFRKLLATN